MPGLLESFSNAIENAFSGVLGVVDVFGDENRLMVAIILGVLAYVAAKFIPGLPGHLVGAVIASTAVYALIRAFGLSEWLGMLAVSAMFGFSMFKLAADSKEGHRWVWTGVGSFLVVCAAFAVFSLLTSSMPDGQLGRDTARAGRMLSNIVGNFFSLAQDGAADVSSR